MRVLLLHWKFWHQGLTRQPLWSNNVLIIIMTSLYHIFMHDFKVLRWTLTIYFYYFPITTISSVWNWRQFKNLVLPADDGAFVLQVKAFIDLFVFFFDAFYVFLHNFWLNVVNLIFGKTNRRICGLCGILMWTFVILDTGLKFLWGRWRYVFWLTIALSKFRTLLAENHMVDQIDGVFDHTVRVCSLARLLWR